MAQNRGQRINEEVMRVLADTLRTVKDPRVNGGMLSIVRCQVTGDLKYATVYVSLLEDDPGREKEVLAGLRSAAGYLRRELAQRVQLRITPELIFKIDHSIVHGARINQLIRQTMAQQPQREEAENEHDQA